MEPGDYDVRLAFGEKIIHGHWDDTQVRFIVVRMLFSSVLLL